MECKTQENIKFKQTTRKTGNERRVKVKVKRWETEVKKERKYNTSPMTKLKYKHNLSYSYNIKQTGKVYNHI